MKQFLSWTILILFLANIGGFFYVFKIQEYAIKKEIKTKIKEGVPKDELHTFVLTESNKDHFEWKHSKEFKYHGMMYDVVYRSENADGSITLECVSDIQETLLFEKLDSYLAQRIVHQNNGKHPLVEFHIFLSHLYCPTSEVKNLSTELAVAEISTERISFYNDPWIHGIYTPPQG